MSPSQANQPLPPGFRLERYHIERSIARGGFSMVYLAYDAAGTPVAVKEYLPNGLALRVDNAPKPVIPEANSALFNEGLKCFFEEGCTLALLDHRNVVRVLDFFRANGTAYLVMAFERGRTLAEHVGHLRRGLDEAWVRRVFVDLLNGLREVHSHGLLHLDIKPANIFLRNDGSPVLLDFGAARQLLQRGAPQLPAIHTPGYAAPEQHARNADMGPWTDIYGIGATMYFCLSGSAPLAAAHRLEHDILVPAAVRWRGRYSAQLLEVIDLCMATDLLRRPQSVFALQRKLAGTRPGSLLDGFARRLLELLRP